MPSAVDQVLAFVDDPDPYAHASDELAALQLEAMRERLEERRAQIPVLDRRARDAGVDSLKSFGDVIPLLFAHTTYKSYPSSFIANRRWDRLLSWYSTLAVESTDTVDLSTVTNIDGWTDALWAAGHRVSASSGTTGKSSFLPATMADRALAAKILRNNSYWPLPAPSGQSLRWYQLTPKTGPYRIVDSLNSMAELMAIPGASRYATDHPMLISDVTRAVTMQRAMAEGTALPGDLVAYEAEAAKRAQDVAASLEDFARDIAEHQAEPMCLIGNWAQQWRLMETMQKLGVPSGGFHPDTLVIGAGGTKGVKLPDGYKETVYKFYGDVRRPSSYGMSEVTLPTCMCPSGRYHSAPWAVLLVLDQSGENLLEPHGDGVEGRAAFFDIATRGRWGGVISGDKITVNYTTCDCGRPGPTIADNIGRYSELEGNDDKLSCAGTMEAYVRSVVSDDVDAGQM